MPILLRKDLVMYLLRMKKAYELYPKEHHDYIDKVSVDYKKMSDDWMEIIELTEDVDHPIRGERIRAKTRLETFMDSLTPEEHANLIKDEEEHLDNITEEDFKAIGNIQEKNLKTLEDFNNDPDASRNPHVKYYLDLLNPNKGKVSLPIDDGGEAEVEEFYKKWKESLSKK